jgi:hypothetical protein
MTTQEARTVEHDNGASDDDSEDPRLAILFSGAPPDEEEANKKLRLEDIQVHERVILDCFQDALRTYTADDPASQWEPPPLYPTDASMQDWAPAAVPLPAWAVQTPQEVAASQASAGN